MPTTKYLLINLLRNKVSQIENHLRYFVGDDATELLQGEFELSNNIYSQNYESATFLNTKGDAVKSYFIQNEKNEFIFVIEGQTQKDDPFYGYFPIIQEPDPSVIPASTDVSDIYFKPIVDPITANVVTWHYVYFSTDDFTNNRSLWDLYQTTNNTQNIISFDEMQLLVDAGDRYQKARTTKNTVASTGIKNDKWCGGLFFSKVDNVWPFDFIQDDAGFLNLVPIKGLNFITLGTIFHPKYEGLLVRNPVFYAQTKLFSYKPSNSIVSNTELLVEFYSTSNISDEPKQIGLTGKIFLDYNKYEFDITAYWPLIDNIFEFDCVCKINEIPFFDHTLIPGLEGSTQAEIDVIMRIDLKNKSFQSCQFIATIENWTLIKDILTLKELQFACTIINTGVNKDVSATIAAKALLGNSGIQLNCAASYPEGDFYFALDKSTPVELHQILEAFIGNDAGINKGLLLTQLEGEVNIVDKSMLFKMAIDNTKKWEIAEGISINNIKLSITKQDTFNASIYGNISIGKINFSLNASFGNAWSFDANASMNSTTFGTLFSNLYPTSKAPQLPDFLKNLTIDTVNLSFKSPSKLGTTDTSKSKIEKHFLLNGKTKISTATVSVNLKLDITYPNGVENFGFAGQLIVSDIYFFDIIQQKNANTKIFLASYHKDKDTRKIDIGNILKGLGISNPPSMNIDLKDAFFVNDTSNKYSLMVADIAAGMNLSNLPLVGKVMPADATLSIALRALYATAIYKPGVTTINQLLPEGISKIVEPTNPSAKGFDLIAEIKIGQNKIYLDLPIQINTTPKAASTIGTDGTPNSQVTVSANNFNKTPVPVNEGVTWFKIGKTFGPVVFNRIGLSYTNGILSVYPDASLSMGGLTFTLNGLSVSSPIDNFAPTFDLKGLGLDMKKGPLEIGATFIRKQIELNDHGTIVKVDEYSGLAIISTEKLSISALGSYTYFQGHHSLFIYAYLNQALGGPSFFFVEGLAAAFGYNRALLMPTIDQVSSFPLVRQVMETQSPANNTSPADLLNEQLNAISKYIPPDPGQMFFAIGIKFNSFKLIDSFVLLAISFGNYLEIDVLGQSNIVIPSVIPPNVPPLVQIKIQLMAKYLPDEGLLAVRAQLTSDSFIFSRDCHLSGGAAFYSWFKGEHAGDFVVTLGGYHPSFAVPSHYPTVPRLALNWQVDSKMSIKGDMYFALCPHAFMAGGHLEAIYHSGALKAWFKVGADFIITWQPYHYDAKMYIDIGASYTYHFFGTHHITVDIGADVHVWGPSFAGKAKIHIWVVNITVAFGNAGSEKIAPIGWSEFIQKCIPESNKIISAAITQGKHSETKDTIPIPIVNSKELRLDINTAIPINNFDLPKVTTPIAVSNNSFGVAPMNITNNIHSIFKIRVFKDSTELSTNDLNYIIEYKKVPSAIWGKRFQQGINAADRMIDVVSGVSLNSKPVNCVPTIGIDFNDDSMILDQQPYLNCKDNVLLTDQNIVNDNKIIESLKKSNKVFSDLCSDFELNQLSLLIK